MTARDELEVKKVRRCEGLRFTTISSLLWMILTPTPAVRVEWLDSVALAQRFVDNAQVQCK